MTRIFDFQVLLADDGAVEDSVGSKGHGEGQVKSRFACMVEWPPKELYLESMLAHGQCIHINIILPHIRLTRQSSYLPHTSLSFGKRQQVSMCNASRTAHDK